MKAKGVADLLTANAEVRDFEGGDAIIIYPTSKGKELIIRMNELAEPIRNYIIELKAWDALTNLIDEKIIDKRHIVDAMYNSPVSFELHYAETEKQHLCPNASLLHLPFVFKESIVQLKLVNVHLDSSVFEGFENLLIKCIYLRYLELDSNEMEESVSERIIKYISEWALDKVKVLKIKNNKLNYTCCHSLTYSINIRIGRTQSLSEDADRKYQMMKNYGPFNSLTLSNCGLEDWFITDFCEILYKYNQTTLLRCDFSDNYFSDRSIQILADTIKSSRVISHLNISGWRLVSSIGLENFLSITKNNTTLIEIDYRRNPVRRRVYQRVFNFLKENKVIQILHMNLEEPEGFYLSKVDRYSAYLGSYRMNLF